MNIDEAEDYYNNKIKFFHKKKYKLPFRLLMQKKHFHFFCVGTPKSGTHSIANIFSNFRSCHEINQMMMIYLMNKKKNGQISDKEIEHLYKASDISNWLEIDSSHYNGYFIEQIYSAFKKAKYILTIRDCTSWLDSWFNHQLARDKHKNNTMYALGRRVYYERGYNYTKHDKALENLHLFPLKAYLEFWNEHNQKIINVVDKSKLLMIKTKEISSSTAQLAEFLKINEQQINQSNSHSYKAKQQFYLFDKIDKNYLIDSAEEICGELNNKYFPECNIKKSVFKLSQ